MLSNNVTLIGYLGADMDIRQLASGQTLGRARIAVSRRYKAKSGDFAEETSWFNLTVWGQQADRMAAECGRGSKVLVEGRLQSRSYENKEGQKVNTIDIVVSSYQLLPRKAEATTSSVEPALAEEAPIAF